MDVASTRSPGRTVPFLEAVDGGLAPDRGLYLPTAWPTLPPPPASLGPEASDTAAWAAPLLLPGVLPAGEMAALAREALDFPIPRSSLSPGIHLLELFHGPTLAFKDVGARFLARLWSRTRGRDGSARTVLVATSGDTGGAVARACYRVPGVRVAVLFPDGRVSPVQRRQFTTLGENVVAVAVDGPFDRCQRLVREALSHASLSRSYGLTSANSINLGRLLPQVFYYLHLARLRGWEQGREDPDEEAVVVPSGNLGNLTAALLARRTGAPLGDLVGACNANDVLVRYLEDGETREAPVVRTSSTAMDVGAPSNLERLITLCGDLDGMRAEIQGVSVPDEETLETMRWARAEYAVTLDPHTAVGVAAARRLGLPAATVLATAHPAKFPEVIRETLGGTAPSHPRLEGLAGLEERTVPLTGGVAQLMEILDRAFPPAAPDSPPHPDGLR